MLRDYEVFFAIKQDNLSYLMNARSEKPLTNLPLEDTPEILLNNVTPTQVAAFYGAEKCFIYLKDQSPYVSASESKLSLIHFAAAGGNESIISSILNDVTKLNEIDGLGNSPLHYAVKYNRLAAVKLLLSKGAVPDVKNNEGFTPAFLAAINGNLEIIKSLYEFEDHMDSLNIIGWSPLHYAIYNRHTDIVEFLIDNRCYETSFESFISYTQLAASQCLDNIVKKLVNGEFKDNDANHNYWSIVHFAASAGCIDLLKYMYETFGIDKFLELDRLDRSVGHIAAINGHLEVLKFLESIKPEMFTLDDKFGKTPFLYACEFNHMDIVSYYVQKSDLKHADKLGNTPLHTAVLKNNAEIVDLLINEKADINARDNIGRTPLVLACETKNLHLLRVLFDNNADPNILPNNNRPIVSTAVIGNDESILNELLERGVDPTIKDKRGWTSVHFAAQIGSIRHLSLFIDNEKTKELFSSQNDLGQTPFLTAVFWSRKEAVCFMLENNVDFQDITDNKHDTALHIAARLNHPSLVHALLEHDVNLDAINDEGQTALMVAVGSWASEVARLLITFGASPNVQDKKGMTAFLLACQIGDLETVKTFLDSDNVDTYVTDNEGNNAAKFASLLRTNDLLRVLKQSERCEIPDDVEIQDENVDDVFVEAINRSDDDDDIYNSKDHYDVIDPDEEEGEDGDGGMPLFLNSGDVYISRTTDNLLKEEDQNENDDYDDVAESLLM